MLEIYFHTKRTKQISVELILNKPFFKQIDCVFTATDILEPKLTN